MLFRIIIIKGYMHKYKKYIKLIEDCLVDSMLCDKICTRSASRYGGGCRYQVWRIGEALTKVQRWKVEWRGDECKEENESSYHIMLFNKSYAMWGRMHSPECIMQRKLKGERKTICECDAKRPKLIGSCGERRSVLRTHPWSRDTPQSYVPPPRSLRSTGPNLHSGPSFDDACPTRVNLGAWDLSSAAPDLVRIVFFLC